MSGLSIDVSLSKAQIALEYVVHGGKKKILN